MAWDHIPDLKSYTKYINLCETVLNQHQNTVLTQDAITCIAVHHDIIRLCHRITKMPGAFRLVGNALEHFLGHTMNKSTIKRASLLIIQNLLRGQAFGSCLSGTAPIYPVTCLAQIKQITASGEDISVKLLILSGTHSGDLLTTKISYRALEALARRLKISKKLWQQLHSITALELFFVPVEVQATSSGCRIRKIVFDPDIVKKTYRFNRHLLQILKSERSI